MELTREEALKYHRQMWEDMQKELGDEPIGRARILFKEKWISEHFPGEKICNDCFLCEFTTDRRCCMDCPIEWDYGWCEKGERNWRNAPISKILALPERKVE